MTPHESCAAKNSMDYLKRNILRHKIMAALFALALLLVLGGWLWAWASLHAASSSIILHFDSSNGISAVGSARDLLWVAAFGIITVIVNALIAFELEERTAFYGKILLVATLLSALLLFLGFAAIINVN